MNTQPFLIIEPDVTRVPFLLSIPHTGLGFPVELIDEYDPALAGAPDDTDWFLDILYDFAPSIGVTTICPRYSRWVIDLNREPSSTPLYDDGRIITALCPVTDFEGTPIYVDKRKEINGEEITRRLDNYFWPYHKKIDDLLNEFVEEFGIALFWDGHSIRRFVPTIQEKKFPDMILGDNDGMSSGSGIIEEALSSLSSGGYEVAHNRPFKGGYITRSKGDPSSHIHALQLEMSKDIYMTENETVYSAQKAEPVKIHLKNVFRNLIRLIGEI